MAGGKVVIKSSKWRKVVGQMAIAVDEGVRATAFAIQEEAQTNIQTLGAIDTGALFSSVYTQTSKSNDRPGAVGMALAKNPEAPIAQSPAPIQEMGKARVGVTVEYGLYIEMGVTNSAFGSSIARPFLVPAAHNVGARLDDIIKAKIKRRIR